MKKWIIIAGSLITIPGLLQSGKYLLRNHPLTAYDKGYICGSILLIFVGMILIIIGCKKRKK
jgi:hypothetical protein